MPPAPPAEDDADGSHPAEVRALMRALGRLRGRTPMFVTDDGERLTPGMSKATIRRRLRGTPGTLVANYGRCVSHSRTCPWVTISIDLDAERIEDTGLKIEQASRVVELPTYRVFHLSTESELEQTWLVWIQPDPERPVAAAVWLTGTLGLERAALGALPIRRIIAALSAARAE